MRAPERTERLDRPDRCAIEVRFRNLAAARTVVLSNGLGCPDRLFRHLVDDLGSDHRVVTWDYRGHGGSEAPRSAGALGLSAHVGDLGAVQLAASAPSAVHLGFGFGAAVALEHARLRPEAIRALVLVQPAVRLRGGASAPGATLARRALEGASALAPLAARAVVRLGLARQASRAAAGLRLVGPTCDLDDLAALVVHAAGLRPDDHLEVVGGLGGLPGEEALRAVEARTLVFAADRDPLCPERVSRRVHELVRGSELARLEGASRASLLELGPIVAARVRRFLEGAPA